MKIDWYTMTTEHQRGASVVITSARSGVSTRVSNRVTALNLRKPGLGTEVQNRAIALAQPEVGDDDIFVPSVRVFRMDTDYGVVEWVFAWGIKLQRSQSGKVPRGEYLYVVLDIEESDAIVDLFGLERLLEIA